GLEPSAGADDTDIVRQDFIHQSVMTAPQQAPRDVVGAFMFSSNDLRNFSPGGFGHPHVGGRDIAVVPFAEKDQRVLVELLAKLAPAPARCARPEPARGLQNRRARASATVAPVRPEWRVA